MPWDPYSQNSTGTYNNPYTPGGYEESKLKKVLLIAVGTLAAIAMVILAVHVTQIRIQQSKNTKRALAAARKQVPNAKVKDVKVADGFAIAGENDPTDVGQANSGYTTIFKVNKDGSMTQIASGSDFSPIDLLELGIPLATQAKLTGKSLAQVQQELADACNYSGNSTPGYLGFDGSFSPGAWQIDAATLDGVEQTLTTVIGNKNAAANSGDGIICVNATQKNSNATSDTQTYISTFTLQLQFITYNGTLTTHTFTFATGPHYYRSYTLDGQEIQAS